MHSDENSSIDIKHDIWPQNSIKWRLWRI